jgi:glycosyltransferase involved in cell wall biosynthesis
VADGVTGTLVTGEDVGELAGVVTQFAEDRQKRLTYGRAGRARVVREFTWEAAAARVRDIQLQVLSARGGRW